MALQRIATQSETARNNRYASSPFVAGYANGGNFDTTFTEAHGACSFVELNPPVWWQVDLLEVYEITKVAITSRTRGNGKHLE